MVVVPGKAERLQVLGPSVWGLAAVAAAVGDEHGLCGRSSSEGDGEEDSEAAPQTVRDR